MIHSDQIKRVVREHYAESLQTGCCGSGSSCCGVEPVGDLAITGPALGCGTPLGYAELKRGETVIDLGSGAGREVLMAAREVGPEGHAIGVDMTPEMIATARENARRNRLSNAEFRLGEIEQLPIAPASADVVISNCVINLVPDKAKAFAEAFRALKPGGRLVVSDMVTHGLLPDSMRSDLTAWAGCVAGAVDVQEYTAALERAGFHDTEILARSEAPPGQVFSITVRARKPQG
ncbi:MAG TPA: arsenite methyltransferase [bacterium]|nr:arsenite methyltransferase [bacterium]